MLTLEKIPHKFDPKNQSCHPQYTNVWQFWPDWCTTVPTPPFLGLYSKLLRQLASSRAYICNPPAPRRRMPLVLLVVHRAHKSCPAPVAYRAQGQRAGVRAYAPLLAHNIHPLPCPPLCQGQCQGPRVDVHVAVVAVVVAVEVFLAPPRLVFEFTELLVCL